MRTAPLAPEDYATSVVAVPPLALDERYGLNEAANVALIDHIVAGGVRIMLYGGNANMYHIDLGRFRELLAFLKSALGDDVAVLPSVGPDFGKALDQAPIVRDAGFAEALVLPMGFPADADGVERGVRLIANALGFGVVLYIKRDSYIRPQALERLITEGAVRFVKYAVERSNPSKDSYLAALISAVGARNIASGMGETPLDAHLGEFGLATFTSGGVCIAPAAAMALLRAHRERDPAAIGSLAAPFLDFERIRARLGGISAIHDAVTISGIADMGPIRPLLSNVATDERQVLETAVDALFALEEAATQSAASRSPATV